MAIRPGNYDFESGFALFGNALFNRVPAAIDTDGGFLLKDRPEIIKQAQADLMAELRLIEIYTECLRRENPKSIAACVMTTDSLVAAVKTFSSQRSFDAKSGVGYSFIIAEVKRIRKTLEAICPGLDNYANEKIRKVMDDLVKSCKSPQVYSLLKACYDSKVTDEVEGV